MTAIKLVDGSNSSRSSSSSLRAVSKTWIGKRTVKLAATPSNANAEWFVDGKSVSKSASASYSFPVGLHSVECKSGGRSFSAYVDVVTEAKYEVSGGVENLSAFRALSKPIDAINSALGISGDKLKWTLDGSYSSCVVDLKGSPDLGMTKEMSCSGGVSVAPDRKYIPSFSLAFGSYVQAGVFTEQSLSVKATLSGEKDGSYSSPKWKCSGRPG